MKTFSSVVVVVVVIIVIYKCLLHVLNKLWCRRRL